MASTVWKGHLTFGLVSFPVRLYSAARGESISFNQLHKADGSGLVARLVGQSERIESARFSPDGKLLAVSGGSPGRFGELQLWDIEKQLMKLSLMIGSMPLSVIAASAAGDAR